MCDFPLRQLRIAEVLLVPGVDGGLVVNIGLPQFLSDKFNTTLIH